MRTNFSRLWVISSALLLSTAACSKVNFSPTNAVGDNSQNSVDNGNGGNGGGTCDSNLGTTRELTKMLFIVDMSGSNEGAPGCTLGSNCTDPGKKMRAGSIARFFEHYGNRTNFKWGFETFQGSGSSALITSPSGASIYSNADAMANAIITFKAGTDAGGTPYMAALNIAGQTIANDPDLHASTNPQYIVVFMSDGQPDAGDSASTILNTVSSIVNLKPGKITFNTVYYGTNDATAAGLLKSMASVGHGNHLNTALNPTGLDFEISDLVVVPCP